MSVLTRLMLKFIHRRGHKAPEQLTLTIAMAYLTYYLGQLAGGGPTLRLACSTRSTLSCCMQPTLAPALASRTQALPARQWELWPMIFTNCASNELGGYMAGCCNA